MIQQIKLTKITLIGGLYVSQCVLPIFILNAVPVVLRQQGVSLDKIGLLGLIALPLMLKFLWSPLIDQYGYTRWGHYRFWIICFQSLLIFFTFMLAFMNVSNQAITLLILGFLACFLCASQDIATDALAVGILAPEERGLGNGIQNAGNYLGTVIGGGGLLLVLDRWGWTNTLLAIASILALGLIPIIWHQETTQQKIVKPSKVAMPYFKLFPDFYRRPGMKYWLLILIISPVGRTMAGAMFRPLLVDVGLSFTEIGLIVGVISYGAGMVGAIMAGLLIVRLGRKQSLVMFSVLEAIALLTYLLIGFGFTNSWMLYFAAICVQMCSSMASTSICTVMMDNSQSATAGTDYTIQTSVLFLSGILASVLGGVIAQSITYQGVFTISCAMAFLGVGIIAKNFDYAVKIRDKTYI